MRASEAIVSLNRDAQLGWNSLSIQSNESEKSKSFSLFLGTRREIRFLNHGSWQHERSYFLVVIEEDIERSFGLSDNECHWPFPPPITVGWREDSKDRRIFILYSTNAHCVLCARLFPFDRSLRRRFYEAASRKNHGRNAAAPVRHNVVQATHAAEHPDNKVWR